jgi:hypothetical protein
VRVRRFELRLLAVALVVCWAIAAGLVLLAYRPGGPLDVVVGIVAMAPIAIAAAGVIWPPVARGDVAFPVIVWLGLVALLCLIPSIGGIVNQLVALGSQTLLPSLEASYPWLVALFATSLFSGFGLAHRLQGGLAHRRRRLAAGLAFAMVITACSAAVFSAVAVANDQAVRAGGTRGSRFGPTTGAGEPPRCDAGLTTGLTARLALRLSATADLRPIGTVDLAGERAGHDFRWLAYVASDRQLGQYGSASIGQTGWLLSPGERWRSVPSTLVEDDAIDTQALAVALTPGYRATAEDRGIEVIDGARARHCRLAVDGPVFEAAFPEIRWLVDDADLHRWRGQLDYWVFLDGELGQLAGGINGDATSFEPPAIQGTIDVRLSATERDRETTIYPPDR